MVLGYQFWQRYYSGDPAVIGRTLQLVRKDYQIVGVMPPRFAGAKRTHAAQGQARAQYLLRRDAQDTPGRVHRGGQCRTAAHPAAVRRTDTGPLPRLFPCSIRSIIELFARPMGPRPAAGCGHVAAAGRLCQRLDPAARPRCAPPAGARGASALAPHESVSCSSS